MMFTSAGVFTSVRSAQKSSMYHSIGPILNSFPFQQPASQGLRQYFKWPYKDIQKNSYRKWHLAIVMSSHSLQLYCDRLLEKKAETTTD